MKKKLLISTGLAVTAILGFAAVNWAVVPPPPANQNGGIYDTTFSALTRADCLQAAPCHVSDTVVVPRHHNLTLPPRQLSCYGDPTANPVTGCHQLIPDGAGGFTFADFRDCLRCHSKTPHHITTQAQQQDCKFCHGSFIDNPLDGHTIPTYAKSSVTPETKWRGNNPSVPNNYGGCAACHQAAAASPTVGPKDIKSNADNHHGTGLGAPTSVTGQPIQVGDCTWCHGGAPGDVNFLDIRTCERCHGVKSLHNIENPSGAGPNGSTLGTNVVPGAMPLGYGHIGADFDCWGCHGTFKKYATDPSPAGAVVPFVSDLSTRALIANQANALTITGGSFTNQSNGVDFTSSVTLTNGSVTVTVQPTSITVSEIQVNIPALPVGTYNLLVVKGDKQSNLTRVAVLPNLAIKSASISGGTVTITGSGFGDAPATDVKTGLGVFAADGSQCTVSYWSDTKLVVSSTALKAGSTVTVKTLYGPTSALVTGGAKKVKR
ncbi:IPT/TIG domain-containing protein [Geobacter hydrogenophilus]|uniref:Cytochrome c n=1 Tax=Geobacter hydrogenophilus TaxID=40983 RepID=A0A9W6FYE1_9BACT|nr:IPT/TIG domain-containing protein [Geobacter hydrogenophilus]MBT0895731.1 IPT/TIG domain-containing protein [Geobacter hydrogenophilus]GLI37104.1 cytochrome c [Geobacter hydrogenophilus]